jgi:Domain of Unknown Function with PDB structure (DUF3857)
MQKIHLLLISLIATATVATAQNKPLTEKERAVEYGYIPEEDLKMTVYPLDSSAEAVVLASKGRLKVVKTDYDIELRYHFLRRVKLLKKSAFDQQGTVKITYFSKQLDKLKAAVIQPNGTRQELTKKEIFEAKAVGDLKTKQFAFPNLQIGSIIEYEYDIVSSNVVTLHSWYFQEEIPVRHSELWLSLPDDFDYVYLFRGRHKLKRDTVGVQEIYADSVPALKPEGHITTMDDYLTQVNFQLSTIKHESGFVEYILSNWRQIAFDFIQHKNFGEQFQMKKNYNTVWQAVKPLLVDAKTEAEKINIIYEFLSKNVAWDDWYSVFSNETLNDAFKKKKANSGELNMMLLACLAEAGVKALPMLVSTREHGKPITDYPILRQFDHFVCYFDRGEKSFIVDVGNVHRPVGTPRLAALNGQGWLLDVKNPRWLPIVAPLSNEMSLASFKLDEDGTLKGSISSSFKGYSAVNEREDEADKDEKQKKAKTALAKTYPDIKIDSITTANLDNIAEPFKRTIYCTILNAATTTGDLIYIKPSLKTGFDENPFKQPKRDYPVEFSYPFNNNFSLNLTIPDGYIVEELPKSIRMKLPENGGSFQYISTVKGNLIQLVIKIQLDTLHFEPEAYPAIKDFFNQIATKSAEQIVLKKKAN